MKVLITGGGGATAHYFMEYLLTKQKEVELFAIARSKIEELQKGFPQVSFEICDLMDSVQVQKIITKVMPDQIFHFASNADVRASFDNPNLFLTNNIISTSNLLETIRHNTPNTRLMMCSTSEVYGNPSTEHPINELQPIAPINPYAVSKVSQDLLAQTYVHAYGLDIIITRMFSYVNPMRHNLALSAFARRLLNLAKNSDNKLIHGYLGSKRTFIDVRDAVECYWEVTQKGKTGEVYNLGGTQAYTIEECLNMLIEISGLDVIKEVDPKLMRPSDIKLQIPDISKFQAISNWKQQYSLKESLEYLWEETAKLV